MGIASGCSLWPLPLNRCETDSVRRANVSGPSQSEWGAITAVLGRLGVPADLQAELQEKLAGTFDGILVYGSWARGDANDASDLDVLALNFNGLVPKAQGAVKLVLYQEDQLTKASGTLFGYHLVRDGRVLVERNAALSTILAAIQPPQPAEVLDRIRSLTPVLDVGGRDEEQYIDGLTRVARYLLRSALYAEALDGGQPCFSVREIAERKGDPALAVILSSHATVHPRSTPDVLSNLRHRLRELIGPLRRNKFKTLHGLIEGAWETDRDLSNFATLILAREDDELPYDELPKVVL